MGVLEPIAAVGDPPTSHADRDGGGDGPPKWQCHVGDETNDREGHPKDFALHGIILAVNRRCRAEVLPRTLPNIYRKSYVR
jgi:hypothetical protein